MPHSCVSDKLILQLLRNNETEKKVHLPPAHQLCYSQLWVCSRRSETSFAGSRMFTFTAGRRPKHLISAAWGLKSEQFGSIQTNSPLIWSSAIRRPQWTSLPHLKANPFYYLEVLFYTLGNYLIFCVWLWGKKKHFSFCDATNFKLF